MNADVRGWGCLFDRIWDMEAYPVKLQRTRWCGRKICPGYEQ